ncbi:MAG TPA: CAP domain-containing protein [Candidatus Binatus sp.]|nr:CAP domain-containing protein [Candidatus Binatus sp.]
MVVARRVARLMALAILLALSVAVPARASTSSDEGTLFNLINAYRVAHGLHPLILSAALRSVAEWRSSDMLTRGYAGHEIPSDGCRTVDVTLRQDAIALQAWGEILAWDEGDGSGSATAAFDWWINSPVHRSLILDPAFNRAGVGAFVGTWTRGQPACAADWAGVDASGVHMYTVVFIDGPATAGSGGSTGPKPTPATKPSPGATPTPSRIAIAAAPTAPAPSAAAMPSDDGRGQGVGLLGLTIEPGGPADGRPEDLLSTTPTPGAGAFDGWLVAAAGLAGGLAYAGMRRRDLGLAATRGRAPRAARSGSPSP